MPCLTGAALMVPRRILTELGPLDPRLPMYFEDLDLCARLVATGYSLHYVPHAALVHLGAESANRSSRRSLLLALEFGEAPYLYLRQYRGRAAGATYRAIMLLTAGLRVGLLLAAAPLLVPQPAKRAALRRHLRRATALFGWALTPRRYFTAAVAEMFTADDGLATNPDFQRELRRSRAIGAAS